MRGRWCNLDAGNAPWPATPKVRLFILHLHEEGAGKDTADANWIRLIRRGNYCVCASIYPCVGVCICVGGRVCLRRDRFNTVEWIISGFLRVEKSAAFCKMRLVRCRGKRFVFSNRGIKKNVVRRILSLAFAMKSSFFVSVNKDPWLKAVGETEVFLCQNVPMKLRFWFRIESRK